MSVIIETHVRSITVMQGCGVIIMFESGVIGPRWGLSGVARLDDDCFAAPCKCLPWVRDADDDLTSVARGHGDIESED
jgi:hypothetical protein